MVRASTVPPLARPVTGHEILVDPVPRHPVLVEALRTGTETVPSEGTALALLEASRPAQWIKNLLVLAAPASQGVLTGDVVVGSATALFAFTALSAGTYLVNDLADRHADAHHPRKRHRPIARGAVQPATAAAAAATFTGGALLLPLLAGRGLLALVLLGYVVVASAYNLGGKHVPYAELGAMATFFLLRVVGGAVAAGTGIAVAVALGLTATAIHLAAGKRHAERLALGAGTRSRPVLQAYSTSALHRIRVASAAVALTAYAWWAAARVLEGGTVLFGLSVAPVVVAFLRYWQVADDDDGQRPEQLLFDDRTMLGTILATASLVGAGMVLG